MVPMSSSQVNKAGPSSRPVVEAPLHVRTLRWTSADIADAVGASQTLIARTWKRTFAPIDDGIAQTVRAHAGSLVGFSVTHDNVIIVLSRQRQHDVAPAANFMRQPRRLPLQALLATDLVRDRVPSTATASGFWQQLLRQGHEPQSLIAISRHPTTEVPAEHLLIVDEPARWQQLLADLVVAALDTPMSSLRQLQAQVNDWVASGRARFEWLAPADATAGHGVPARVSSTPRPLGQALADDAFRLILARVTTGQLVGGDRITETSLQRALHTSRTQIRDVMRTLALGGLVQLEPHRGAIVPIPTTQDVLDIYDARLALGRVLITRAALDPHRDLRAAESALRSMARIAGTSDARATGDADVRFQDALVASSALPQIHAMFRALSSQILLYTAVLGVKYVYSIPEMLGDDIRIMDAVKARDVTTAVEAWESKIDAAKHFMAAHLR